jgi:hypothetical protein
LPDGPGWRDVLSGATLAGPRPLLSELLERHPVALLVAGDSLPGHLDVATPPADDGS